METSPFGKAASRMLAPTSSDEAMPEAMPQTNAHKAGHTPAKGEPSPDPKRNRAGAKQTAEDLEAGPSRPVTRDGLSSEPLSPQQMRPMRDALDAADNAQAQAFEEDCLSALLHATDPSAGPDVLRAPPRRLGASLAVAAVGSGGTASGEAPAWLADPAVIAREVAAAKAEAVVDLNRLLGNLTTALGQCDRLEKIPKERLKQKDITDIAGDLFSFTSLFGKNEGRRTVVKAQFRVRKKLDAMIKETTKNRNLALQEAGLNARLRLELEARAVLKAASAEASLEARRMSIRACAQLMQSADKDILNKGPSGNLGKLLAELKDVQVERICYVAGKQLKQDNLSLAGSIVQSLDAVLAKRPPEEVAQGEISRVRAEKLAPRSNRAASQAFETDIRSACKNYAADTTLVLGTMPSLEGAEGERLRRAHDRRMDAPASQLASVHFCMPFDSTSLSGETAAPLVWPELNGQPRQFASRCWL